MPKFRISLLVLLILGILTFTTYCNILKSPFIWDDVGLIVENPDIKDPGNILKIFKEDLYSSTLIGSNFYRPIQSLSFMLDYKLWQLEPFGYHLTNVLLQVLVSFLVFLFLFFITADFKLSFFSSLLFSVSPLNIEAVTYISGRAEMLMSVFLLSSFLSFGLSLGKVSFVKRIYVFISYLSFIFSLLSKELALVLPIILMAYLYFKQQDALKSFREKLKVLSGFFFIVLIYTVLRLTFLKFTALREMTLTSVPLVQRLVSLPKVIFTYLKILTLPVDLHMSRSFNYRLSTWEIIIFWLSALVLITLLVYLFIRRKKYKNACFILAWSFVLFIPQSGIFPINSFIAEHFIYLPQIGFFVLLFFLLRKYLRKVFFIYASILIVIFYGVLSFSRNLEWSNPILFYESLLKKSPGSFQAYNNLGMEYEKGMAYKSSIDCYRKALLIKPDLIEARSNLANVYYKSGMYSQALEEYAKVRRLAPYRKLGEVENNIGCAYELKGDLEEALRHYNLALKLDQGLNFAHFNIARIYKVQGKTEQSAIAIFNSLPEIKSREKDKNNFVLLISEQIPFMNMTQPALFYNDLGVIFANKKYFYAASICFKRSLELNPSYGDAYFNLGLAFWNMGEKKEAVKALKMVIKISPNHLRAKRFLKEIIFKK